MGAEANKRSNEEGKYELHLAAINCARYKARADLQFVRNIST